MNKKYLSIAVILLLVLGTAPGFACEDRSDQEKRIEELIGNLGTRYWDKAADELVEIGEAAVDPLIVTLNIGTGRPSQNANFVLVRIGTQKAVAAVILALKNQKFDFRVRANAAAALGEIGSEDFVVPLIEALQTDNHWWVRNFAVGALGKIGSERVVEPISRALNDENLYVRRAAVSVLGELKSDKAVLPLIGVLDDDDWQVRLEASNILESFGNKGESFLLDALKEENYRSRMTAANVLGRIRSQEAVLPLICLLEDQEWMVRDEAAVALSRINSTKAVQPLLVLLEHEAGPVREEAAWVLGEMRSKDSVQALIKALDDREIGWMAAVSLGKIGDEQAVEPLKKKMADQDSWVGQAAAWALTRMRSETRNDV